MLNHIMYSISLTNYHIKKRPFTTNYLVGGKKYVHLLLLPSTAQPDELFKKIQILHTYRLHLFIHVEEENKICSSSSRQSYNLKQFAEHPVASFVYLPAHKCTSPDFTGAVTQPPPKKKWLLNLHTGIHYKQPPFSTSVYRWKVMANSK